MQRRVVKVGDRRYRVDLPGGDRPEFSYREKPQRWDPEQCINIEFDLDDDRYNLSWEGIHMDSFQTEADVLLFIIRFGYDLPDSNLVPSEILADFNLAYEAGDWVDDWCCKDKHEIIFSFGEVQRPPERKIRFEDYPRSTQKRVTWVEGIYYDASGISHPFYQSKGKQTQPEVVAEIKIPKLNFEELEKPKRRRFEVPRTWADPSDCAYGGYMARKGPEPLPRPDEECVTILKAGKAAKKAFKARKRVISNLRE